MFYWQKIYLAKHAKSKELHLWSLNDFNAVHRSTSTPASLSPNICARNTGSQEKNSSSSRRPIQNGRSLNAPLQLPLKALPQFRTICWSCDGRGPFASQGVLIYETDIGVRQGGFRTQVKEKYIERKWGHWVRDRILVQSYGALGENAISGLSVRAAPNPQRHQYWISNFKN